MVARLHAQCKSVDFAAKRSNDRPSLRGETMDEQSSRRRFFRKAGMATAAAGLAELMALSQVQAADGFTRSGLINAVKRARIFDLSHTWDENSPIAGVNPPYAMSLTAPGAANHAGTRGAFGDEGQLSFAGEV